MRLPSKVDNNTQRKIDVFLKPFNKYFWLLVAIVLVLIFREVFVSLVDKILVAPFLSKVQSNLFNDILFFILSILIGYAIAVINIRDYILAILGLIAYLVIRFSGYWHFKEFSVLARYNLKFIAYTDLLFLASFIGLIFSYFRKTGSKKAKKEEQNNRHTSSEETFEKDKPIEEPSKDLLNRSESAEELAKWLINTVDTNYSFSLGIYGEWGSGKTSFLNLIKLHLKNYEDVIIIDFSPWRFTSPDKYVEAFFDELNANLSQYSTVLSGNIRKYVRTVLSNGNFIERNFSYFLSSKSNMRAFNDLQNEILKIKKKIIVFIDDLDRLESKELIEVLKLIRNTANFKNIGYVIAYDRNYVIKAIEDFTNYAPDNFLEKFFDIEFVLPYYSKGKIKEEIIKFLKKELVIDEKEQILKELEIKSFRELKKIKSLLKFNKKADIESKKKLQWLIYLKIKYPAVAEELVKNTEKYFLPYGHFSLANYFVEDNARRTTYDEDYVRLKYNHPTKSGDNDKAKELYNLIQNLGYKEEDIYKIIAYLLNIFSDKNSKNNLWFLNITF